MDLNKSLRLVVDTGKVKLGTDRALKAALVGAPKLVVVAANMEKQSRRDLDNYCRLASVPVVEYRGTSLELGTVCGKPFPVSALTIFEEGESDVLKVLEEKEA